MRSISTIAFLIMTLSSQRLPAEDWLDLTIPSIKVSGSLIDCALELRKYGIRVCVEDVALNGEPPLTNLHVTMEGATLRKLMENVTRMQPELGWTSDHFLMCPVLRLFRKSSVDDPRNPLNVRLMQFHIQDGNLYDISKVVYYNSEEFRKAVNPGGIHVSYAGSQIGGISIDRQFEIRYSIDMKGWTARELLNCLGCVSVNNGVSWFFWYDAQKRYPENFIMRKF